MSEPTEQEVIAVGRAAQELLASPAYASALQRMEHRAYSDFKSAETSDRQAQAHALSRAIELFQNAIHADAENGKAAEIAAEQRAKREQQQAARTPARR